MSSVSPGFPCRFPECFRRGDVFRLLRALRGRSAAARSAPQRFLRGHFQLPNARVSLKLSFVTL